MIQSVVKAYKRTYKTKGRVKPTVKQTKQINLSANCDLEGDDVVYILTEDEYKDLATSDESVISELQSSLESKKDVVERLSKELGEYKEREKIATDILSLNNKLITDNEQLNIELRQHDKVINELKLVNQLLINRSLIARILNRDVDILFDDVSTVKTNKE